MSFLTQQEADKIIEERTREEVYKEFKEALIKVVNKKINNKILGLPSLTAYIKGEINLEDVLIAFKGNLNISISIENEKQIVIREEVYNESCQETEWGKIIYWNLGLPASLQSSDTLIAITNLLK